MKVAPVTIFVALCALSSGATAQGWPVKSGRIVVPFQPGGGADTQARLLGKKFTESMGQSFIVASHLAIEMREAIIKDGAEPVGSTPEELVAYFKREVEKYAKVIQLAKVQSE